MTANRESENLQNAFGSTGGNGGSGGSGGSGTGGGGSGGWNGFGPTEGGSVQRVTNNSDGSYHVTSFNKGAGVHLSQNVSISGEVTGRHWTDHNSKMRIGDRD